MSRREVPTELIRQKIISLTKTAALSLSDDVKKKFSELKSNETAGLSANVMDILIENSRAAEEDRIPLCQDCGSAIIFLEIGSGVILTGSSVEEAVNSAVSEAYESAFLRKSIVADPLRRVNTNSNTPAFIHTEFVPGDSVKVTVYLKGGGSENMSSLKMFRPTADEESIIDYVVAAVIEAGPNPCPPLFLGIGIGGTADSAMLNSKKALLRGLFTEHPDPYYAGLERKICVRLNSSNVGPLGFGGRSTAAGVYILEAPTHIATLPVALNMNCHSLRIRSAVV